MSAAYYRDESWRRLPWLLPLALLLSAVAIAAFLWFLSGPRYTPPPPPAIQVDVVELPAPPPPHAETLPPLPLAPEPPPPPVVEPEPLPPPSEPAIEPALEAPQPPPPKPVRRPQVEAPRPVPTTPPPQTTVAPPPPPSAASTAGNTMGPRALYQPKPEIPEELRHHRLDLVAVARFQVAANGSTQVELIEPTPEPSLNRAILETLKKWRFFPALENGKAAAATIDIRIPLAVQ